MQRRVGKLAPIFNEEVLINDSQFNSQYFRVSEVPANFTAGKNKFKIYGDNSLLLSNSTIAIQITDVNGNPVYHQVNNYIDGAGAVLISVFVYPETPPGLGRIQIMGIASRRPNGRAVPTNFANRFNVRWTRDINIQPEQDNFEPIIFNKAPGVKVVENVREYLTQTYNTGLATVTQSTGTITYSKDGRGPDASITIEGAQFTQDMNLGTITVPFNSSFLLAGEILLPGSTGAFTSVIKSVINNTTIKVQPYALSVERTEIVGDRDNANTHTTQQTKFINNFVSSNYTASFLSLATYTSGSLNSQSFASITLKNLDPIVGKVHTIKTFMKSHGFNSYQLVGNDILPERDLLVAVDSALAYDRIGDYKSQEIIDEYWESGSYLDSISFTNKHDDSEIISAMIITGSEDLTNSKAFVYSKTIPNIDIYKDNEYELTFKVVGEKNAGDEKMRMEVFISGSDIGSERRAGANLIGRRLVKLESTADIVRDVSQFNEVNQLASIAGTGINIPSLMARNFSRGGRVQVNGSFETNTITDVSVSDNDFVDERLLELSFTPTDDTDVHVVFVVYSGKWYISDVKLQGAQDLGFTPNHTFIEIPIDVPRADDLLDFKFEFLNEAGAASNIMLVTESVDFRGSNLYISGDSNQLSGSVVVGNGIVFEGF